MATEEKSGVASRAVPHRNLAERQNEILERARRQGYRSQTQQCTLATSEDIYAADCSGDADAIHTPLSEMFRSHGPTGLSIALEGDFQACPQDSMGMLRMVNSASPDGSVTVAEVASHPACGILVEANDYGDERQKSETEMAVFPTPSVCVSLGGCGCPGARLRPVAYIDTCMAFHQEQQKMGAGPFVLIHKTDLEEPCFLAVGEGGKARTDEPDVADALVRRKPPIHATVLRDTRSSGRYLVRRRTLDGPIMFIATCDPN
eukprot:1355752-Amphidinium_carterae.1